MNHRAAIFEALEVPIGLHRKLGDDLLGALRSWCARCDDLRYVGDEPSLRMCCFCEGAGSAWAASDEKIGVAYAELLARFPFATSGVPLPVYLIPDESFSRKVDAHVSPRR
jgi:hypothetical protein